MVRIEREQSANIIKTFVSDQLTKEDYFKLLPALQHTVNEWTGVRWYWEMKDFSGWEPMEALTNLKFDIEHVHRMSRIAMVGSKKWQKWLTKSMMPFTSAEVHYFDLSEKEEAILWLKS